MTLAQWPTALWYALLTGLAGRLRHPRAAVRLDACRRAMNLHFHALGGDRSRDVSPDSGSRRRFARATHRGNDLLAWIDRDQVHVPDRINRYPSQALNRELYFWLAAYFALDRGIEGEESLPPGLRHLLRGVATSARVVERFPPMASRHARLCAAELEQRRDALPAIGDGAAYPVHHLEAGIRHALGGESPPDDAWLRAAIEEARHGAVPVPPSRWRRAALPFLPVFLWGSSRPEESGLRLRRIKRTVRRRARGTQRSLAVPRFDPVHHPEPASGVSSRGEHLYSEWDYRRRAYRPQWCRVTETVPRPETVPTSNPDVSALARRVRQQFESLCHIRRWTRGQETGDELDLEACVDSVADRRGRGVSGTRLYRRRERRTRDLSVAILLDASRSTATWVGEHRVIVVARQSMTVLAEALAAAGDEFALFGFASDSRLRVRCERLKDFTEPYEACARGRLRGLQPRDYTRMGAAIRHVGARLVDRTRTRKLMLVVTDGRPHDPTDRYEGRYALEDTRRAVQEVRARGMHCYGLTIDRRGRAWLPQLFGPGHYAVFSRLDALPAVLPRMYARITGLAE